MNTMYRRKKPNSKYTKQYKTMTYRTMSCILLFGIAVINIITCCILFVALMTSTSSVAKADDIINSASKIGIYTEWIENNSITTISRQKAHTIALNTILRADEIGVHPELLLAIMAVESGYKPNAKSNKGAVGLMQVRAIVHKEYCREQLVNNISYNIMCGSYILAKDLFKTKGNMHKALMAYNGSNSVSGLRYSGKVYLALGRIKQFVRNQQNG